MVPQPMICDNLERLEFVHYASSQDFRHRMMFEGASPSGENPAVVAPLVPMGLFALHRTEAL